MDESIPASASEGAGILDIGKMLGRREAFGLVAGRCSAAEASCLRTIRESKQYKSLAPTWDEFCSNHLHMSRAAADRTIRLHEEFGGDYFELTQLVRIPPEAFRAIAPAVKDKAVHIDGESIALAPENAHKVAEAIGRLRNRAAAEPEEQPCVSIQSRLEALQRRGRETVAELTEIHQSIPGVSDYELLSSVVDELHTAVARLRNKMRR